MSTVVKFRLGDRVQWEGKPIGVIVGGPVALYCPAYADREDNLCWPVLLDRPFWSPDKGLYVTTALISDDALLFDGRPAPERSVM